MSLKQICIAFLLSSQLVFCSPSSSEEEPQNRFRNDLWPGVVSQEKAAKLKVAIQKLQVNMNARDRNTVDTSVEELQGILGKYVGVPEKRPVYPYPPDTSIPDISTVEKQWLDYLESLKNTEPWRLASPADAEYQSGPRLRKSYRLAIAMLRTHFSIDDSDVLLDSAFHGLSYIQQSQTSSGVFGFPYDPQGSGLRRSAAKIVDKGLHQSIALKELVENGWIIDDLGDGGLQFDNGVCGNGLAYAYILTDDNDFRDAARLAGDWATKEPIVTNWNYNSFSGALLSRLYRITGESKYLDEARVRFYIGVLPGQMSDGRWVDPHNARIQYHSILLRALCDFYTALTINDPSEAEDIKQSIVLGLDNLAMQINSNGASNLHELLSLDVLCIGSALFGGRENWTQAINISVNAAIHFNNRTTKQYLPESIATYLLVIRDQDALALEFNGIKK
ncbi:MAG: hypothetical protein COA73_00720 [Candidatus Hydrogenedentota bacterium]|nr:MAG: hypothetical protein COA73_00720 [Candidatus Hydrogenedentota bacterium]